MKLRKFIAVFLAGIAVQAAIYLYLDQVLFAPTSDFQIGGTNQQEAMGEGTEPNGRSFYSYDKRFMATIVDDRVTIYEAGKKNDPQRINLHGRKVSFFEWLTRPQPGYLRHLWPRQEDRQVRRLHRPVQPDLSGPRTRYAYRRCPGRQ